MNNIETGTIVAKIVICLLLLTSGKNSPRNEKTQHWQPVEKIPVKNLKPINIQVLTEKAEINEEQMFRMSVVLSVLMRPQVSQMKPVMWRLNIVPSAADIASKLFSCIENLRSHCAA